jgi:hypothetical protein
MDLQPSSECVVVCAVSSIRESLAVAALIEACHIETRDEPVGTERYVDGGLDIPAVVASGGDLRARRQMIVNRLADDLNRAGGGVAAEKRSLWAAQYLDPLHIEQVQCRAK